MSDRLQMAQDAEEVLKWVRKEVRALKRENRTARRLVAGADALYRLGYSDQYVDGAKLGEQIPQGAIGRVYGLWVYPANPADGSGYLKVDEETEQPFRPLGKEQGTYYALVAIKEQYEACAVAGMVPTRLVVSGPVLDGLSGTRLFKMPSPPAKTLSGGAAGLLKVDGATVEVFEMRPGTYSPGAFKVEVSAAMPEEDPVWTDV